MISRKTLSIIVFLVMLIWIPLLILDGVIFSISLFRPFGLVVSIVLLFLATFDLWIWKIKFLNGWLIRHPNLNGTWRVNIISNWVEPSENKKFNSIQGYLVIHQTYSTIHMRLMTEESSSEIVSSNIIKNADGSFRLAAFYRNEPSVLVRSSSPIHYGALLLEISIIPKLSCRGYYWTDRDSKGEMELIEHHRKKFTNFDYALKAFSK